MRSLVVLPFFLGVIAVLQGTLNGRLSQTVGLGGAVLLNSAVVMVASLACWFLIRAYPQAFPASFAMSGAWKDLAWWFPVTGLFGFAFVLGLPYAFEKVGAFQVVLGLMASQLLAGLLWDRFALGSPITATKVFGAGLAIVGAWLVNRR